jgi:hypothetical protein
MSNPKHSDQPPFGLTQPILSGVIAVCLGVASATAPDLFKTPLFALSMVVAVFAGWLLARSQWPWFNRFHLRFKKTISVIFSTLFLLALVASVVVAFRSGGTEPIKFDSADYPLRADYATLSTNFINVSNELVSSKKELVRTRSELTSARSDNLRFSERLVRIEEPRFVKPEQITNCIQCLRREGASGPIVVGYQTLGPETKEAREYTEQILTILNGAQLFWQSKDAKQMNWASADEPGVLLFVRDEPAVPAHCLAIQKCFLASGIGPMTIRTNRSLSMFQETNVVIIWVGQKY